jgi:hypothetical protein
MRIPMFECPARSRLVAVQMLALVMCLNVGGCPKDNGSGNMDPDAGSSAGNSACADNDQQPDGGAPPPVGPPSGATCPKDNTLTYDNFGKQFMDEYCTRCHSSKNKTCAQRMNAPLGHDFDTYAGIIGVADHIDEKAAAGPNSTNTAMPKNGKAPSVDERKQLGQWLACEQEQIDKANGH